MKIEEIVKKIMEENKELFEQLAKHDTIPLSSREREIMNFIIDNKEEISNNIMSHHYNSHYNLLPNSLYDIYLDNFKTQALDTIKKHLESFNLNPEESAGLEDLIIKTIGINILRPNEHN